MHSNFPSKKFNHEWFLRGHEVGQENRDGAAEADGHFDESVISNHAMNTPYASQSDNSSQFDGILSVPNSTSVRHTRTNSEDKQYEIMLNLQLQQQHNIQIQKALQKKQFIEREIQALVLGGKNHASQQQAQPHMPNAHIGHANASGLQKYSPKYAPDDSCQDDNLRLFQQKFPSSMPTSYQHQRPHISNQQEHLKHSYQQRDHDFLYPQHQQHQHQQEHMFLSQQSNWPQQQLSAVPQQRSSAGAFEKQSQQQQQQHYTQHAQPVQNQFSSYAPQAQRQPHGAQQSTVFREHDMVGRNGMFTHHAQQKSAPVGTTAGIHSVGSLNGGPVYLVQFKRTTRDYVGATAPIVISIGDFVVVECDRNGEDVGVVTAVQSMDAFVEKRFNQMSATPSLLTPAEEAEENAVRRVLRIASIQERQLLPEKLHDETAVIELATHLVRNHFCLPMKVLDAEYQFDRLKLTIYYAADCRVDFRELVREIFASVKTRIWMKKVVQLNSHNHVIGNRGGAMQDFASMQLSTGVHFNQV